MVTKDVEVPYSWLRLDPIKVDELREDTLEYVQIRLNTFGYGAIR